MRLFLPFPLWFIRMVVRRNPWLLAERGEVSRSHDLDLGICEISVATSVTLLPKHRARLQAEADAGTLFKPRRK
jgi:hypothetical protein